MVIRSSSMWSNFCQKYKQDRVGPPVKCDDNTAVGVVDKDMSSYIARQSTAAANEFLTAPHKKGRIKKNTKGSLPLDSKGSQLSTASSNPGSS
jgi:hypothetical protein